MLAFVSGRHWRSLVLQAGALSAVTGGTSSAVCWQCRAVKDPCARGLGFVAVGGGCRRSW